VVAIEEFLGLDASDYRPGGGLGAKLRAWLDRMQVPFNGMMGLMTLAGGLEFAGESSRGLAILEWVVGIEPGDYQDVERLSGKWEEFLGSIPPDVGATCWRVLVGALERLGEDRYADVLGLLEADSGLRRGDDQSVERIRAKLRPRLQRTQVDTRAAYVVSLVMTLRRIGQHERASRIVDWFVRDFTNFWAIPAEGDPGVVHVVPLLAYWLGYHAGAEWDLTIGVCRQAVRYLRQSLSQRGIRLEDRRDFIGYVNDLRRTILEVGHSWAGAGDAADPECDPHLEVQLWDAELGQRVLFEKFLLTDVGDIPPADAPIDGWPFMDMDRPPVDSYLPDEESWAEDERTFAVGRLAVDYESIISPPASRSTARRSLPPADWLTRAEAIVRKGLEATNLADLLGPNALLLRAGFLGDETLVWTALASDGRSLRVAASGRGQPGDRSRIAWACLRHDLGLSLTYLPSPSEYRTKFLRELGQVLKVVARAFA
jgi:hypothetical protein